MIETGSQNRIDLIIESKGDSKRIPRPRAEEENWM